MRKAPRYTKKSVRIYSNDDSDFVLASGYLMQMDVFPEQPFPFRWVKLSDIKKVLSRGNSGIAVCYHITGRKYDLSYAIHTDYMTYIAVGCKTFMSKSYEALKKAVDKS